VSKIVGKLYVCPFLRHNDIPAAVAAVWLEDLRQWGNLLSVNQARNGAMLLDSSAYLLGAASPSLMTRGGQIRKRRGRILLDFQCGNRFCERD